MHVRRGIRAAAAAALAVPALVAVSAPASAATPQYAHISIQPSLEHPGYYDVYVYGHYNTSALTSTVGMRLKGDDPVFNDDLGVSRTGQAVYGDFSLYALVSGDTLDEDWDGRDEVFATVSSSTGFRTSTENWNQHF